MEQGDQEAAPGRRLLAGIVDAVVLIAAAAVLAVAVQPLAGSDDDAPGGLLVVVQAAAILGVVIVPLLALVLLEAATGTSPGKRVLGLRVATPEGSPPGVARSARRLVYRISPVAVAGTVAATTTGRRPWHDDWTGTVVRGGRRARSPPARPPPPRAPTRRPRPARPRPPCARRPPGP